MPTILVDGPFASCMPINHVFNEARMQMCSDVTHAIQNCAMCLRGYAAWVGHV